MPKLTQKLVDTAKCPQSGQVFLRDDELECFGVRLTKGCKSYVVECRQNGKARRITVGRSSRLTVDEAREAARNLLKKMDLGIDPLAEKKAKQYAAITLAEVLDVYLATKQLRPTTIDVYRRQVNNAFKDWLHRPIVDITKNMVEDKHRAMSNGTCRGGHSGRAYANGCFTTLQALLNFAAEKYEIDGEPLITVNPVSRLTKIRAWNRVHPRTGVIPEAKIGGWYRAARGLENKTVCDYFLLVLFTGIRRREGTNLKWTDVDFAAKTITIRREQAKNNRDHVMPMSLFLLDLLENRFRNKSGSPYVFPGRGNKGHLTDFRFGLLQVRERSGCNFMVHDLRRTFLSAAERLELPYYVLKRLANHKISPDSLTPYIIVSMDRLRAHMEKISQHFLELADDQASTG